MFNLKINVIVIDTKNIELILTKISILTIQYIIFNNLNDMIEKI